MKIHYFREKRVADKEIKEANKILKNNTLNEAQKSKLNTILEDIKNRKNQIDQYLSKTKRAKFFRFFNKKFGEAPKQRIDEAIGRISERLTPQAPPPQPEHSSESKLQPEKKLDEDLKDGSQSKHESEPEPQPEPEPKRESKLEPEPALRQIEAAMPILPPKVEAKKQQEEQPAVLVKQPSVVVEEKIEPESNLKKEVVVDRAWDNLVALRQQLEKVKSLETQVKFSNEFKIVLLNPKNNLDLTSDSKLFVNSKGTTFHKDAELQEDLAAALEKEFVDACEQLMRTPKFDPEQFQSLKKYLDICSQYLSSPPTSSSQGFFDRFRNLDSSAFTSRLEQGLVHMVQAYNLLFIIQEQNVTDLVKVDGGYFAHGEAKVQEIKEEIAAFLRERGSTLSVASRLNLMIKYAECLHANQEPVPEEVLASIYELAEAFCVFSIRVNSFIDPIDKIAQNFAMEGLKKILKLRSQQAKSVLIPVPEKQEIVLEDPLKQYRERLEEAKNSYATDKSKLGGWLGKTFAVMPSEAFESVKSALEELLQLQQPFSIKEVEARIELLDRFKEFLTFKDLNASDEIKEECKTLAEKIDAMRDQDIPEGVSLEQLLLTSRQLFPKGIVEDACNHQFGEAFTKRIMEEYFGNVGENFSRDKVKELIACAYVHVHEEDLNDGRSLADFRPSRLKERLNLSSKIADSKGIFKALEQLEAYSDWDDLNGVKKSIPEALKLLIEFANQEPYNATQFHSDPYLNIVELASSLAVALESLDDALLEQIQRRLANASLSWIKAFDGFTDEYILHLTVLMSCIEKGDVGRLKRHFTRHPLQSPLENGDFDDAFEALHHSEFLAVNAANMPGIVDKPQEMIYTLNHQGRFLNFKVAEVVKASGLCCQILIPLNWEKDWGAQPLKMVFEGFNASAQKLDRSFNVTATLTQLASDYLTKGQLEIPEEKLAQQPGEAVWKDPKTVEALMQSIENVITKGVLGTQYALEIAGADLGGMDAQYAAAHLAPMIVGEGRYTQQIASMTVKTYNQWGIPMEIGEQFNQAYILSKDKFLIYHSVTKDNEMQFVGATLLGNRLEGVPKVLEVGATKVGRKGSNWQKIMDVFNKVSSTYAAGQYQAAGAYTPFRLWSSQRGAGGRYFRRFGFLDNKKNRIGLHEKLVDLGMMAPGDVGLEVRSKRKKAEKSLGEQALQAFFNALTLPQSPAKQPTEKLLECASKSSYQRMRKDEVLEELEIRKKMTPRQVRNLLKYGLPKSATGALQEYLQGQVKAETIIQ